MNIGVIELSKYTQPIVKENARDEWVEYGEKNDHYNWLIDRYRNSATHNACVNAISRLAYGKGLSAKDASRKPGDYAQMKALISSETLRKVLVETKMLGAGCFQVVYSDNRKKITKVDHLPINLLRPEKCDEKGIINAYWYSDDWSDIRTFPPKRIPLFGKSKEQIELVINGRYSVGRKYYFDLDYEGCIDYTVLEEEIATYLINETQNSFAPTMIVNFNNGTSDEKQRDKIAKNVTNKLTGSTGKKIVIGFNNNKEQATTVDPVPLNDAPAHYEYLSTEARNKILAGHNVTSPMLVGISPDGQGFSSNADEIEIGSKYFHNTVVVPLQELVIDSVDKILGYNGISLDLYFGRLNLLDDLEAKQQQEEQTRLSKQLGFDSIISKYGEVENLDGWKLVDEREVDYDHEDDFDLQISEHFKKNEPSLSFLQKVVNLVKTGTANPNASSSQDANVDGFYFKVRYQYTGNPNPERDFCRLMMSANKIYRKEDIVRMSSDVVNAGFGEYGADTYDIFKFKGGARCHHKWLRKTYVSTLSGIDVNNPNANTVSTNKAEKFGYVVRNPKEVAMTPNDMPRKGFSPNNKNLPKDAL